MVLPAATKVVAGDMEDGAWFSLWKRCGEATDFWKPMETYRNLWKNLWKPLGGDISKLDLIRHLDTIVLIPVITCYNIL